MRFRIWGRLLIVSVAVIAAIIPAMSFQHDHHATSQELKVVHFQVSCKPSVSAMFDRAVTLLHSFWFKAANDAFRLVAHSDVDCAMAWWGMALAHWGDPFDPERSQDVLETGRRAIASGGFARSASDRERQYISAVAALYRDYPTVDQNRRQRAYREAMMLVSQNFPDDSEAAVFAALAALPGAETVASRRTAGTRLESLYRRYPGHPGLAHYLIHAYDHPALADQGLEAATQYARVAPSSPHALHVSSHIFTRLGLWAQAIDANLASADAARRDGASADELHALDYQVYAFLQTGQDQAAAAIVRRLSGLRTQVNSGTLSTASRAAAYFALAAMPARYALERGDWPEAAALEVHTTSFSWVDAMTYFARGLGASRSGHVASARLEFERLTDMREATRTMDRGWAARVDLLCRIVESWILFAERKSPDALTLLQAVASDEATFDLPQISPGSLAPAGELLGEMLLEMNQPEAALAQFERLLAREPNRLRTLHGAARAADETGMRDKSAKYYQTIVDISRHADNPPRALIEEARVRQR